MKWTIKPSQNQLQQILSPRIYEGFKSIYEELINTLSQDLYEKKWISLKTEKNEFERKQKTLRYLQSKGCDYDEISGLF